jgi:nicotinamide-nucleotide amidase
MKLLSDSELNALAAALGRVLARDQLMLVTAESCTGGWVARVLTAVPGSSNWFDRGFVSYSNEAKTQMLDVPVDILSRHGAVSEPTVRAMAEGALRHSRAQVAVAITGIAGPDGGTIDKPVGTVWFGWSRVDRATCSQQNRFDGDREAVRRQSVAIAIEGLLTAAR